MKPRRIGDTLDQFVKRLIVDCMLETTSDYWLKRAATFESALPRPGDYFGNATPDEVQAQADTISARALACRRMAELVKSEEERERWATTFDEVWNEAS